MYTGGRTQRTHRGAVVEGERDERGQPPVQLADALLCVSGVGVGLWLGVGRSIHRHGTFFKNYFVGRRLGHLSMYNDRTHRTHRGSINMP